jgi:hypothetical protein
MYRKGRMVKTLGYISIIVFVMLAHMRAGAQAVGNLSENFDVSCAGGTGFPAHWLRYNPIGTTIPQGQWNCGADIGNGGTPGMQCTGYYSSAYHLDTAYLLTPLLNLSTYSGKVYLQFDTKTSKVHSGARFTAVRAQYPDSTLHYSSLDSELTSFMSPVVSDQDSSDWVTHFIDLTSFKGSGDMYVAFRYTSTASSGSIWYLDNVRTTTTNGIVGKSNINRPLTVIGTSTTNQCKVSFSSTQAADAVLSIFDMVGKMVHQETISMSVGEQEHIIYYSGFRPGTYLVKMDSGNTFGVARMVIW